MTKQSNCAQDTQFTFHRFFKFLFVNIMIIQGRVCKILQLTIVKHDIITYDGYFEAAYDGPSYGSPFHFIYNIAVAAMWNGKVFGAFSPFSSNMLNFLASLQRPAQRFCGFSLFHGTYDLTKFSLQIYVKFRVIQSKNCDLQVFPKNCQKREKTPYSNYILIYLYQLIEEIQFQFLPHYLKTNSSLRPSRTHGSRIELTNNSRTATRLEAAKYYDNGVVYSALPLSGHAKFVVQVCVVCIRYSVQTASCFYSRHGHGDGHGIGDDQLNCRNCIFTTCT